MTSLLLTSFSYADKAFFLSVQEAMPNHGLMFLRLTVNVWETTCDPTARRGLWVLRDGASGNPVGCIGFRRLPGSDVAILSTVWLLPEYRGRGLAEAAATEAAERLLNAGASSVEMHITADNAPSLAVATKAGFHLSERSGHSLKVLIKKPT